MNASRWNWRAMVMVVVMLMMVVRVAIGADLSVPAAPPCGTVAVYSALRSLGIEVTAEAVAERLGPGPDHRLDELAAALQALGAHAELARLKKSDLLDPPWARGDGAWILAVDHDGRGIDHCFAAFSANVLGVRAAQFPDGVLSFTWAELDDQWHGETIVVRRDGMVSSAAPRTIIGGLLLAGAGGGLWWMSSPRRRLIRHLGRAVLSLSLLGLNPDVAMAQDESATSAVLMALEQEVRNAPFRLGRSLNVAELVALIEATGLEEEMDPAIARVVQVRIATVWHATRQPVMEVADVQERFAARRDGLVRFDGRWAIDRSVDVDRAGSLYQVPDGFERVEREVRFAKDGPFRYSSLVERQGATGPEVGETRVTDGVREYLFHPVRGMGQVQWPENPTRYLANREPWPAVGGLVGSQLEGTAFARERDLADLLEQVGPGAWVAEEMVLVRGRPAIALSIGFENPLVIYLDPARDLAPLRVDDLSVRQGHRIRTRTEMFDLELIGVYWMPRRIVHTQARIGPAGDEPPYLTESWVLEALSMNQPVARELFDPNTIFPRGVFVVDDIAGRTWRQGLEPAEFLQELGDAIDRTVAPRGES